MAKRDPGNQSLLSPCLATPPLLECVVSPYRCPAPAYTQSPATFELDKFVPSGNGSCPASASRPADVNFSWCTRRETFRPQAQLPRTRWTPRRNLQPMNPTSEHEAHELVHCWRRLDPGPPVQPRSDPEGNNSGDTGWSRTSSETKPLVLTTSVVPIAAERTRCEIRNETVWNLSKCAVLTWPIELDVGANTSSARK